MCQQVEILSKRLLNIFHNYIPNKFISCGNKEKCGNQIFDSEEKLTYQRQIKSGSIGYAFSNAVTLDMSNALSCSKVKYYESLGLFPPRTAPETY